MESDCNRSDLTGLVTRSDVHTLDRQARITRYWFCLSSSVIVVRNEERKIERAVIVVYVWKRSFVGLKNLPRFELSGRIGDGVDVVVTILRCLEYCRRGELKKIPTTTSNIIF